MKQAIEAKPEKVAEKEASTTLTQAEMEELKGKVTGECPRIVWTIDAVKISGKEK